MLDSGRFNLPANTDTLTFDNALGPSPGPRALSKSLQSALSENRSLKLRIYYIIMLDSTMKFCMGI